MDVVIPTNFSRLIAEKVNGMVLPTINYGYKSHPTSGGGQLFPGTTSLDGETLIRLVHDILRETHRHGGRRFLIFNGHYENERFLEEAADLFFREDVLGDGTRLLQLSWWDQISDELVDELFEDAGFPGWDTEHAGITETALMQYFAPELVRYDEIRDDQSDCKPSYTITPSPPNIIPESGCLYKATYASSEKGEKIFKDVVDRVVQIINQELGS